MGRKSNRQKNLEDAIFLGTLGTALEAFAELANETRGCSFSIYKRQRDSTWVVNLQNIIYEGFQSISLLKAIQDAARYILQRRKKIRGTYYTMFN